ncbi:alpha/beta hydrolase [Sinomonas halotolerans]|uniref:Alpha/beta hydrolase n=1 Tax=Sinomonas halotolerans TaxID=1644133 RepID=A0ABU9X2B3_9MICC
MESSIAAPFLSSGLAARERRRRVSVLGSETTVFTYEPVPGTAAPAGGGRPDGTVTVLAVHGFRGTHHGLLRIVDALPQVRFVMPDLPGFGESTELAGVPHGIEGYGAWLRGLAEALGLGGDTVLLGHSFGSIVAAHFVAADPERFARLVLVNPISAPALEGPQAVMSRLAEFYYWAAARLPHAAGSALLRSSAVVRVMSETMAKTRDAGLREFVHAQHAAHFSEFSSRTMLLEAFKASISHHAAEVAGQLALPVLLIAGDRDEVAHLPDVRRFHDALPDSRLTVIDGVGHLIHYETPQPAAAAISAFLQEETA